MKELSWKPFWSGKTYCAPACGRGCTRAEWRIAMKGAEALAKKMGAGWTPSVWESFGWHYKVQSPCGRIRVHPTLCKGRETTFCAFLGEKNGIGGRWVESGATPHTAVSKVVRAAKADLKKLGASLEGL